MFGPQGDLDQTLEEGDELQVMLRVLAGSVRLSTGLIVARTSYPMLRDHTTFRGQPLADVVRRDLLRELHMACGLAVKYAPRPLW